MRLTPMLQAADLNETISFYTGLLGFTLAGRWPEAGEAVWCDLYDGECRVMFFYSPPHEHGPDDDHEHPDPAFTGTLYFSVPDVDGLYASVKDRAKVLQEPQDMPYGMREFQIADPTGYALTFGQNIE